jgi:integrase
VAKQSGKERRMVLGDFGPAPKLTVTAARRLAAQKRALVDLGHDPWLEGKEERAAAEAAASRKAATLANLMGAYVAHLKATGKASWREVEQSIERNLIKPKPRIAALAADEVSVDAVMPLFHRLIKEGKLREAEKLRSYLRAAYNGARKARNDASMYAFEGFRIHGNPLADLEVSRPKEAAEEAAEKAKARKWAFSEEQLAAYWRRIQAATAEDAMLRFHLLTGGQRVQQLARLTKRDDDPDLDAVTLRDTKGRRTIAHIHTVPLIPDARKALDAMRGNEGPHIFTLTQGKEPATYQNLWDAMNEVAAEMIEAGEIDRKFSPGIIRKTVETRLAAKGVPDEVLGRLASHGLAGVQARHYNAHHYDDEKREALMKLRALCEPKGKPGNVTPIRRKSG